MMWQLMLKTASGSFTLLILGVLCIALPTVNAKQGETNEPTATQEIKNVEVYDTYAAYLDEDKLLNASYKELTRLLDKNNLAVLKQVQRKWIEWRDSKCYSAQKLANRQIGVQGSSVRDDCLSSLTEHRNIELQKFIKNSKAASKEKFNFSRNNDNYD